MTDAWTSPNHKAFVAVLVHFKCDGEPLCLILDVVEVAEVYILTVYSVARKLTHMLVALRI
jgi:hypothetical protein